MDVLTACHQALVADLWGAVVSREISLDGGTLVRRSKGLAIDVTARLHWCTTHMECVWVYGDGSHECPHDLVIESSSRDHVLVSIQIAAVPQ